ERAVFEFDHGGLVGVAFVNAADLPGGAVVVAVNDVRLPRGGVVGVRVIAGDHEAAVAELDAVAGASGVPSPTISADVRGDVFGSGPGCAVVGASGDPHGAGRRLAA